MSSSTSTNALASGQVLATASRAVLGAGPEGLAAAADELNRALIGES